MEVLPAEETPALTQLPDVLPELSSLEDGRKSRPTEEMLTAVQNNVQEILKSHEGLEDSALASRLVQDASNNSSDILRYALLQTALEKAIAAGDAMLARNVLHVLSQGYDVPLLTMQQMTLDELCTVISKPAPKQKEQFAALCKVAGEVCVLSTQQKQYDRAESLYRRVYELGTKLYVDSEIRKTLLEHQNYFTKLANLHRNFMTALDTLKSNPDDVTANRRIALWYSQVERDMMQALPYFAKCDYAPLRSAAQLELASDKTPANLLKVADQWWDLSHNIQAPLDRIFSDHAISLYETIDRNRLDKGEQVRVVERIEKQRK